MNNILIRFIGLIIITIGLFVNLYIYPTPIVAIIGAIIFTIGVIKDIEETTFKYMWKNAKQI